MRRIKSKRLFEACSVEEQLALLCTSLNHWCRKLDQIAGAESDVEIQCQDIEAPGASGEVKWAPCADRRSTWIGMGISLFQFFEGHDDGLHAWYDWSFQTDNASHGQLLDRWNTFTPKTPKKLPYFWCSFARS
jgi:hypothetical protein